MDRVLLETLSRDLRLTDDFYRFGFPGYYVLVLAGTPRSGAHVVRERMARKIAGLNNAVVGRVDIDVFAPDAEQASLEALLPTIARHYYAEREIPDDPRCPVPVPDQIRHGSTVDFANRLRIELGIALRCGQEISILDFRSSETEYEAGHMVARYLNNLPSSVLRGTDGVYVLDRDRCVVLLAGTD
jgi:hypothetical protein